MQQAVRPDTLTLPAALELVERSRIGSALAAERGNVRRAARRLGIPRRSLYRKLARYGIAPSEFRIASPMPRPNSATRRSFQGALPESLP